MRGSRSSVATVAITLVMMAFMFPVALKWTVEKARNVFVMVFMLVFVGGGLIAKTLNLDALSNIPLIPISIGICVCAVLMYVISYCVSCRIYEKKEF
ncbi:MAG: ABC-2 transporter permease [Evtepia sp.]